MIGNCFKDGGNMMNTKVAKHRLDPCAESFDEWEEGHPKVLSVMHTIDHAPLPLLVLKLKQSMPQKFLSPMR